MTQISKLSDANERDIKEMASETDQSLLTQIRSTIELLDETQRLVELLRPPTPKEILSQVEKKLDAISDANPKVKKLCQSAMESVKSLFSEGDLSAGEIHEKFMNLVEEKLKEDFTLENSTKTEQMVLAGFPAFKSLPVSSWVGTKDADAER